MSLEQPRILMVLTTSTHDYPHLKGRIEAEIRSDAGADCIHIDCDHDVVSAAPVIGTRVFALFPEPSLRDGSVNAERLAVVFRHYSGYAPLWAVHEGENAPIPVMRERLPPELLDRKGVVSTGWEPYQRLIQRLADRSGPVDVSQAFDNSYSEAMSHSPPQLLRILLHDVRNVFYKMNLALQSLAEKETYPRLHAHVSRMMGEYASTLAPFTAALLRLRCLATGAADEPGSGDLPHGECLDSVLVKLGVTAASRRTLREICLLDPDGDLDREHPIVQLFASLDHAITARSPDRLLAVLAGEGVVAPACGAELERVDEIRSWLHALDTQLKALAAEARGH